MELLKRRYVFALVAILIVMPSPSCAAGSFEGACLVRMEVIRDGVEGELMTCAEVDADRCNASFVLTEFVSGDRCSDLGFDVECENAQGDTYFSADSCPF